MTTAMNEEPFFITPVYHALLCGWKGMPGLYHLYKASAAQLCRSLLYSDDSVKLIKKRLRKLADNDYVLFDERPTEQYRSPYYYVLGNKGVEYVKSLGLTVSNSYRPSKEIGQGYLHLLHHTEVNDHLLQQMRKGSCQRRKRRGYVLSRNIAKKGILPMTNESVSQQGPAWPKPNEQQVLQVFEPSGQDLCGPNKRRAGRPATVSWNHRCLAMMLCLLRGWNAQWEVWRLLRSERLGAFAPVQVSDQAIDHRMERAAVPLQWLFEHISAWLRTRLAPWQDRRLAPWASAVSAADARTLEQMSRFLPWLRTLAPGDSRLLAGQISALFAVRFQQWVRGDCCPHARDHCSTHFLALVEHVQAGALLLFDRGSFSFAFFDTLTTRGIWWISRSTHQVSSRVSHLCSQADGILDAIVDLGTVSSCQAQYPVRLIQFWLHGRHDRSLSNVLDPHVLRLEDVVNLYARRWESELAFRALKDHLNLHHLWSAKWAVIQVPLWWCLILAPVSHALQGEIAGQAGVEVFEVSLDLLIRLTAFLALAWADSSGTRCALWTRTWSAASLHSSSH